MSGDSSVVLAEIGAPHGVKGEVRVKSFTADPMAIKTYGSLRSKDGRVFEVERLRVLKGDMLVVKFRGVDDRDAAAALNRRSLFVERSALPATEPEEFYHADLIGLAAVDPTGVAIGTVTAVDNFGAGDMIEIAPAAGGPSLLVPFTKACVPAIDIEAERIVVALPDETEVKETDIEEEDT